ncbi:TraR/DksA family transcriptional regulator [Streptomyces sp. NPDC059262]|uniref:TraR/DksA family transcriptional regulator n=1 Tax=Streptomyces sp. NPDC059262 TaxID=3346797 RepID=UPI0036A38374
MTTQDELAVGPGEKPWSPKEVVEARKALQRELLRLREELLTFTEAAAEVMRDRSADETDAAARESALAGAAGASEAIADTERALERLEAGTYGRCGNCAEPVGKARMQESPRETLCAACAAQRR